MNNQELEEINIGDVVCLKSDPRMKMTVTAIDPKDPYSVPLYDPGAISLVCSWWAITGDLRKETFPLLALVLFHKVESYS